MQVQVTRIDRLCGLVEQQRAEIFWLRKQQATQREEVAVLRDCLIERGVLGRKELLTRTRWNQLGALRAVYSLIKGPAHAELHLNDAFMVDDVALAVCLFLGVLPVRILGQASKQMGLATKATLSVLMRRQAASVFVCGGRADKRTLDVVERYDVNSNSWSPLPNMRQRRNGASAGVLRGQLYVCGGRNSTDPALSSTERFDPDTEVWEELPAMEYGRWGAASGAIAGRFYVCGGFDENGEALGSGAGFDPDQNVWEALPPMLERVALPAACPLEGELFVCGGRDRWSRTSAAERFDAKSGVWQAMPPMREPRSQGSAAGLRNKVFVCCGLDEGGSDMDSVEVFSLDSGEWQAGIPMDRPRSVACGVPVAGKIFICGGVIAERKTLNATAMFDPRAGRWLAVAPLAAGRAGAAAAVLLT